MPPLSPNQTEQLETQQPPVQPVTYEQFLAWVDEDTHAEWVNGKVVFMSPVSREHSNVLHFLVKLLGAFVEQHDLGEIHTEPFQMKTGLNLPGRSPDLIFVAKENAGRFRQNYLDGPADLVVEIVSPESRGRDRGEKFYEYEEGGVREYWLIDLPRQKAEFFQLGPDGRYQSVAVPPDGRFKSAVLTGFWLNVDWFWQRPLPKLSDLPRANS
jgi:Uma2 family endonuclease